VNLNRKRAAPCSIGLARGAQPAQLVPTHEAFGPKNQFFGLDEQVTGGGKSYITKCWPWLNAVVGLSCGPNSARLPAAVGLFSIAHSPPYYFSPPRPLVRARCPLRSPKQPSGPLLDLGAMSASLPCSEPPLLFAIRDAEPLDCFRDGGLGVGRLDVSDRWAGVPLMREIAQVWSFCCCFLAMAATTPSVGPGRSSRSDRASGAHYASGSHR
jgi:hypothetical protein